MDFHNILTCNFLVSPLNNSGFLAFNSSPTSVTLATNALTKSWVWVCNGLTLTKKTIIICQLFCTKYCFDFIQIYLFVEILGGFSQCVLEGFKVGFRFCPEFSIVFNTGDVQEWFVECFECRFGQIDHLGDWAGSGWGFTCNATVHGLQLYNLKIFNYSHISSIHQQIEWCKIHTRKITKIFNLTQNSETYLCEANSENGEHNFRHDFCFFPGCDQVLSTNKLKLTGDRLRPALFIRSSILLYTSRELITLE